MKKSVIFYCYLCLQFNTLGLNLLSIASYSSLLDFFSANARCNKLLFLHIGENRAMMNMCMAKAIALTWGQL